MHVCKCVFMPACLCARAIVCWTVYMTLLLSETQPPKASSLPQCLLVAIPGPHSCKKSWEPLHVMGSRGGEDQSREPLTLSRPKNQIQAKPCLHAQLPAAQQRRGFPAYVQPGCQGKEADQELSPG